MGAGGPRVLRAALDLGASVTVADARGWTPLHHAATRITHESAASVEVVRALLDAGADPGAIDGDGKTPLEVAAASWPKKGR